MLAAVLAFVRPAALVDDPTSYMGHDRSGVPHYARLPYTVEDRQLLHDAFGITTPTQLYLSDSSALRLLKYDTEEKRCFSCFVDSYRIGFVSLRRRGETWDAFERRVRAMRRQDFPASAFVTYHALDALDPDARPAFEALLAAGRRAGFQLNVGETYRTTAREAWLLHEGGGRTFTATSMHSYGRAVDISVGDGNPARHGTRRRWIAFRRFVISQNGGRFRLMGTPERTWDWPHVELPSPAIGFHSIGEALSSASSCTECVFPPHLPGAVP